MSFVTDIAKLKDPVTILLSKALPSRGHTRTTHARAEKLLFPSPRVTAKYTEVRAGYLLAARPTNQPEASTFNDSIGVEYARSHSRARRNKELRARARFMSAYQSFGHRRMHFQRIMVASLLGNYPHVSKNRLHGAVRGWTHARLLDERWLAAILHGCPLLFLWCVREFLVDHLSDAVGLRAAVAECVRFTHFKRITGAAMDAARTYFQQNACHTWSDLGQYDPPPVFTCRCLLDKKNQRMGSARKVKAVCVYAEVQWLRDLSLILRPFHEELLLVAFKKPDTSVVSFLTSEHIRLAHPLVPRKLSEQEELDHSSEIRLANQLEQDEDEYDQMCRTLIDVMSEIDKHEGTQNARNSLQQKNFVNALTKRVVDENDASRKATECDRRVTANVFQFVSPCHFQVLVDLVHKVGNNLSVIMRFLPVLGVKDAEVGDFVQRLLHHCEHGTVTKHERTRQVQLLRTREPHAYNLLQVTAELIRHDNSNQARVVGQFSSEEIEHQIAACRARSLEIMTVDDAQHLGVVLKCIERTKSKMKRAADEWSPMLEQLQGMRTFLEDRIQAIREEYERNPMIEESCVTLQYCQVCSAVYSNYRSLKRTKKRPARWGLQDAWRRISPAEIVHCGNHRINHIGECSQLPLAKINLLGVRVMLDKTLFQLCVQCADVMVPSAKHCVYTSKGMLCVECSRLHVARAATSTDPARAWAQQLNRTCLGCNYKTCTDQNTVLLPFNIVLCKGCTRTKSLMARVREVYTSIRSQQEAVQVVSNLFRRCKTEKTRRQAVKDKPAMLRAKQKSRMKRR